jgi:hypothetical protein
MGKGISVRASAMAVAAAALSVAVTAQTPRPLPRTPDGRPDFQGIWYFGSATPLERPREFADKPVLTPDEAEAFERREADRIRRTPTVHAAEWLDYGTRVEPDLRSSLITDPPDGRVPAVSAEARARLTNRAALRNAAEGPESFPPHERCIVFGAGPPVLPGPYNNNLQIVQTPGTLAIVTEMIHDARIVPLDEASLPPAHVRSWLGASRGRWDGDALVVETTHFNGEAGLRGSDEHLRVVERFTLQGPDALRYEFTIDNPTTFGRPWSGALTMSRTTDRMYEFACHEGNSGLPNMMQAARFEERRTPPRR